MSPNSFLKHTAIYMAGNLLAQAIGFVLLPIYMRCLAPAEYGTLEVLSRISEAMYVCLLIAGIRQATHTFYRQAETDADRQRVTSTAIVLVAVLAVLGGSLSCAAAGPLSALLGTGNPAIFRLAFLSSFLEAMTIVPLALAQARIESGLFVAITLAASLFKMVLSIVFVVGLGWGVWGVLAASALTAALFGCGLSIRELLRGGLDFDPATCRAMVRFSAPFLLAGGCSMLLHNGDRFFLVHYAGETEVGLYAVGYKLALIAGVFSFTPLFMVWSARMFDVAKLADAPRIFGRVITMILAAYAFAGIGLCLFRDDLVAVLGGDRYAGAAGIVPVVVIAYLFMWFADLMDAGFYIQRRTGVKVYINISSTILTTLFYSLLIPRYGLQGGAYATLGGFACHAALTRAVSRRFITIHLERGRLAVLLGSLIVLSLVSAWIPRALWAIPVKAALWLAWPGLLWLTGLIAIDEKQWIRLMLDRAVERTRAVFARPSFEATR